MKLELTRQEVEDAIVDFVKRKFGYYLIVEFDEWTSYNSPVGASVAINASAEVANLEVAKKESPELIAKDSSLYTFK